MTSMRILANLGFVVPAGVGGTEQYSVRLLQALRTHSGDLPAPAGHDVPIVHNVVVAGHRSLFEAHPGLARFEHTTFAGPVGLRPYRLAVESSWLAQQSRGAALVHHFGGRVPALSVGRTVLTVHDLQHLDLPENVHPVKQRYLRWAIPRSLRKADLVCTPSAWVKERLTDRYGIDAERIRVVSSTASGIAASGAEPTSPAPSSGSDAGDCTGSLTRLFGEEIGARPMVLYPALTHPHKNHETLIEALAALRSDRPDLLLVLTGAPGRSAAQVASRIRSADPHGRFIRHLGRVPETVLVGLTARADVLAFPSRYEGFGLPVLEAMQLGTPVVAADATAIPEVVDDAAVLVDPDDVQAWAAAIDDVASNESRRRELVVAGKRRAAAYSPQAAAAALRSAWRDALA